MKTGFVTLLMIGVAMGQTDDTAKVRCSHTGAGAVTLADCKVIPQVAPKPAKPSAKKAKLKDGYYLQVKRCIDGGCVSIGQQFPEKYRNQLPPLDVPAIRETRPDNWYAFTKNNPDYPWCGGMYAQMCEKTQPMIEYWTCPDPDAYSLQISVSRKAANCHRIGP